MNLKNLLLRAKEEYLPLRPLLDVQYQLTPVALAECSIPD
jgi:hypothetical protein